MLRLLLFVSAAAAVAGYAPAGSRVLSHSRRAVSHSAAVHMDETLFDDILSDELEKEGAEKPWLSEAGWALYLDSQNSGYAMNEKVSEDFKYFTAGIFGNPLEVIGDFFEGLDNMTAKMFPISKKYTAPAGKGDKKGKPVKAEKDKGLREVGKPGFANIFGSGPTKI
ncbi:hypothetical protein KFE25_002957 [Diacronema lutheri]|uniref:Uncharacterized protein n=1 Tax=Diacronema lutheri TaxID=2081491 RepID=A0A8J6CDA9_DIALT|nr:hypothetical protein KFE25_002957 [Diacronema lutheri]